ncbi:hypothetical protein N7U66_12610 [Lacinutrix neustonica]|uniref:Uncharacterized protein n=1 Tax=Lacinutrix neustonica TaxID=2980107 RepID=A0A9E8MUR5_9FLAO|nr:hypothetical protein [Lacinutrix neustonica]WAC01017.1 hypothetical protein N7U66_12610 [Lacinutrix neustonica]
MRTQNKNLEFTQKTLLELNDNNLLTINGGGSTNLFIESCISY